MACLPVNKFFGTHASSVQHAGRVRTELRHFTTTMFMIAIPFCPFELTAQCAGQIADYVARVFQADRESDQTVGDAGGLSLRARHIGVRH